jgi:hypothetical protein
LRSIEPTAKIHLGYLSIKTAIAQEAAKYAVLSRKGGFGHNLSLRSLTKYPDLGYFEAMGFTPDPSVVLTTAIEIVEQLRLRSIRQPGERVASQAAGWISRLTARLSHGSSYDISKDERLFLFRLILERFCPRFAPDAVVLFFRDCDENLNYLDAAAIATIGGISDLRVVAPAWIILFSPTKNVLFVFESIGEKTCSLKEDFRSTLKRSFQVRSPAITFVTLFKNRNEMRRFIDRILWGTAVWIVEEPDHVIYFNGTTLVGPVEVP